MKWVSDYTNTKNQKFEIEKIELFNTDRSHYGFEYKLVVYAPNVNDLDSDYQDTLQFSKEIALEDFGVPLDSWRQVE